MSNDLLLITIWLTLLLISSIVFITTYICFIKKNFWKINFQKAKDLNLTENTIRNLFGISNKLRWYLSFDNKHLLILNSLFIIPFLIEVFTVGGITIVFIFYGGTSDFVLTITLTISLLKTFICTFSMFLLPTFLDKQINKNIYVDNICLDRPKDWLTFLYSKDIEENKILQKKLIKYYQSSFMYIVHYDTFYEWGKNKHYNELLIPEIMNRESDFFEINELSIYIGYITLINNWKNLEDLLKRNIINPTNQQPITKEQLIEYLITNVYAISLRYVKRIKSGQIYFPKKLINDFFNQYKDTKSN